jgi:lipopolysaccharide/colanic/teichoic acid biosynthesis glycosyltransferase
MARMAGIGRDAAAGSGVKRALDVFGSLGAAVFVIPVVAVVAVVVRVREGTPAFYHSRRIGEGGRPFDLWKVRTMTRDADRAPEGSVTVGGDRRITETGRVLRRWKLDELPQIFNVLAGDMSLVGPRPETPEFVALYTDEQRRILRYRPGLTSPGSVAFVNEAGLLATAEDPRDTYLHRIMPEEIRLDLEYMRSATVFSDLRVLLATVAAIGKGRAEG